MEVKTLNWIRKNTKKQFQDDVLTCEFFNKQRNDKEYLNKVKTQLIKDIEIVGAEFLQKRNDELKYINYLIKN